EKAQAVPGAADFAGDAGMGGPATADPGTSAVDSAAATAPDSGAVTAPDGGTADDAAAACTLALVDEDGDGAPDGVDLGCDGSVDLRFADLEALFPPGQPAEPTCEASTVDNDGDGQPDGIDFDCDGNVDLPLTPPGDACQPALID